MRISDWSSDVCSSDLSRTRAAQPEEGRARGPAGRSQGLRRADGEAAGPADPLRPGEAGDRRGGGPLAGAAGGGGRGVRTRPAASGGRRFRAAALQDRRGSGLRNQASLLPSTKLIANVLPNGDGRTAAGGLHGSVKPSRAVYGPRAGPP